MDILQSGLEGLQRAESVLDGAARRIAEMPLSSGGPLDMVDLSAETVELMVARRSFGANVRVMRAAQETTRSTLNLLA